ncbi:MAG TPA: type II toxin-antitoxin system RelE/ParE family toxin [Caulobacteraceae bacterium]|nr:type II toxin-antitoxin system RelE/ParE family toxin [Caulobacteraceae bacterium]
MAQVVWTKPALVSLEAIRAYIQQFSPLAAQRMALRLIAAGMSLADNPERGRTIGQDRRELVTVPPYLIRYRIRGGTVEILAIRHGAQRPL